MMKDFVRSTPARLALSATVFALTLATAAHAQAPATPVPAPAQKAAPAAPAAPQKAAAPAAPAGPPPEWVKVCGGEEEKKSNVCSVSTFILDSQGEIRGRIQVLDVSREKDGKTEKKRLVEATVPTGTSILPGIYLVIDGNKEAPIKGLFKICFQNACITETPINDDTLAKIRKANMLELYFFNIKGEPLGARISLAGFNAVYDGKAMDPKAAEAKVKAFQESQNKLQSELAKRAEEQRKKLQEQATPAAAKTQ